MLGMTEPRRLDGWKEGQAGLNQYGMCVVRWGVARAGLRNRKQGGGKQERQRDSVSGSERQDSPEISLSGYSENPNRALTETRRPNCS